MQSAALPLALALIAAPAAASAAAPMSLVLVGMDPNFAGAVDSSTLKTKGDIVSLDLVTVTADPNGAGEGLGRVAVSHMSFDCRKSLMTLTGGFSQSQTGDLPVRLRPDRAAAGQDLPDARGHAGLL